jgi:hypothetical protein
VTYDDVINKIRTNLAERMPGGTSLRYIILTRDEAEILSYPLITDRVTKVQLKEALQKVAKLEIENTRLRNEGADQ